MEESVVREIVEKKIFMIRGEKVMLSIHLAEMYGVEIRALIQSVKRNIDRFPEDFMFQLNPAEKENWISQIVISDREKMGLPHLPFSFYRKRCGHAFQRFAKQKGCPCEYRDHESFHPAPGNDPVPRSH